MEEDRKALDRLYDDVLAEYPPGARRDVGIERLYAMAAYTRCPHWQPNRKRAQLKLCEPLPTID
jgi:hypothetical protein